MHLPALAGLIRSQNVTCAAVCDLNEKLASQYAQQLASAAGLDSSPQVFRDMQAMLDTCSPDGVLVLVAPAAASSVSSQVARRRVPFLAEKPPAPDTPTHRRLIKEVGDLPHVVAYNRRHAPYVVQARQWMQGLRPQSVTCLFSRYRRRDPDFTTTAVHAIDTVRFLANDDYATLRIEAAPAGPAINYFVTGWTRGRTRVDILMTPDTASAVEHYTIRAADRAVFVSYPQPSMMDVPGFVELHEQNRVVQRMSARDFDIAPDDASTLCGILGEQASFCRVLRSQAESVSTLAGTLQTQQVREALSQLLAAGGRGLLDLDLTME